MLRAHAEEDRRDADGPPGDVLAEALVVVEVGDEPLEPRGQRQRPRPAGLDRRDEDRDVPRLGGEQVSRFRRGRSNSGMALIEVFHLPVPMTSQATPGRCGP